MLPFEKYPVFGGTLWLNKQMQPTRSMKRKKYEKHKTSLLVSVIVIIFFMLPSCATKQKHIKRMPKEIVTFNETYNNQNLTGIHLPEKSFIVMPPYPKKAMYLGNDCDVTLEITVDELGKIVNPGLIGKSDICLLQDEFDNSALASISKWEFVPAKKDGNPIPITYQITYHFELEPVGNFIVDKQFKAQALINRGSLYAQRGEFGKAITDFSDSILDFPTPVAFSNRGYLNLVQGNYEEALSDYNKAIEMDKKNGKHYAYRGQVYSKMNDCIYAIEDFKRACELGYDNACDMHCP